MVEILVNERPLVAMDRNSTSTSLSKIQFVGSYNLTIDPCSPNSGTGNWNSVSLFLPILSWRGFSESKMFFCGLWNGYQQPQIQVPISATLAERAEKVMVPHSSTLAWKLPWTEEPGGLQSKGSLRVGHDWATSLFSLSWIGEGNGNPLQCSCLENPRDGGAWWAAVYGVAQSRTWLKPLSSSSSSWAGTTHGFYNQFQGKLWLALLESHDHPWPNHSGYANEGPLIGQPESQLERLVTTSTPPGTEG